MQHVTSVCGAKETKKINLWIIWIPTCYSCTHKLNGCCSAVSYHKHYVYSIAAYRQWAAVRMCLSPITLPPQLIELSTIGLKSITKLHCHGQEYLRASVPPTMRFETSGSNLGMPQLPASTVHPLNAVILLLLWKMHDKLWKTWTGLIAYQSVKLPVN